jgi:hypothetical protein
VAEQEREISSERREVAAEAQVVRQRFLAEFRDAIEPRTAALVLGVMLLQFGFIFSYIAAFHAPKPHQIPLAVVAPAPLSRTLVGQLNAIPTRPLLASAETSEGAAGARVRDGSITAALVVNGAGRNDRLLVASAGGVSAADAVEQVLEQAEAREHRSVAVTDLVPLQSGDGRGLSGFYLVIGWIVGGYLVSSLLAVARGSRPATLRRAIIRLLVVAPYAILSGLGGALIVDQGLGALTGHFIALWWLGALLVYGAIAVTMAFQILLGVMGIGLAVLVFVVLGNPSAGGAYQPDLLPAFWRALSGALPNGAGTDTVRRIVYFGSDGISVHLIVLAAYAIGGVLVTLLASHVTARRIARGAPALR